MREVYEYDEGLMKDFNWFLRKINERACIQYGFIDKEYEPVDRHGEYDMGLEYDIEYFHPSITLDDRMRYIAQNFAYLDDQFSALCNTIISHMYGARGVHTVLTGEDDPKKAIVDFTRIRQNDRDYIQFLRETSDYQQKVLKRPVWGTTELHTSVITAAKNFCKEKYEDPDRKFHTVDLCEWVASFKDRGIIDRMFESTHMRETYKILTSIKGVGQYFGFHGSASTSVLPFMNFNHDQRFVRLGTGANYTVSFMWPEVSPKDREEVVYFLRERGDEIGLTDGVEFHPETHNVNGVFSFPQDTLKYHGTEVLVCQFGIYKQIRKDPKACANRRVPRLERSSKALEGFFS